MSGVRLAEDREGNARDPGRVRTPILRSSHRGEQDFEQAEEAIYPFWEAQQPQIICCVRFRSCIREE